MENCEICPVCQVTIEGDSVKFSCGKPGTRERLWARVCQYAKQNGCTNNREKLGTITESDRFKAPGGLCFDGSKTLQEATSSSE